MTQSHEVHAELSRQTFSPLRWVSRQWCLLRERGVRARAKAFIKKLIRPILKGLTLIVRNIPGLRKASHVVLNRMPWVKARLLAMLNSQENKVVSMEKIFIITDTLTPRAKYIYLELQIAIQKKKQGEN